MAEPRQPPSRLTTAARGGYERAVVALERLVPVAKAINLGVLTFAVVTAVAALTITGSVLLIDVPGEWWVWVILVLLLGVLLAPGAVLLLFFLMLREALALPAKMRQLPDVAPERAAELGRLVAEARARDRAVSVGSLPRDSWRAGRLLLRVRDDIPWAGVLISLVRVPFLLAVLVAFAVGAMEVLVAPPLLVIALFLA